MNAAWRSSRLRRRCSSERASQRSSRLRRRCCSERASQARSARERSEQSDERSREEQWTQHEDCFASSRGVVMKVKKGDTVLVIAGKDRGVKGKVLAVSPETGKVIVEGVNR